MQIRFPSSTSRCEVLGIPWGEKDVILTPAFWKHQVDLDLIAGRWAEHKLGDTLEQEVAACILGGYGLKAEVGLAAFNRLRERGLFEANSNFSEAQLERWLSEPLEVEGRQVGYRFQRQKARYLFASMTHLRNHPAPDTPIELRDYLLKLSGIGPKTASWIVRNLYPQADVAIIDIHIYRAGVITGFFNPGTWPQTDYFHLENEFLRFAYSLGVAASTLDAVMWDRMRQLGRFGLQLYERLMQHVEHPNKRRRCLCQGAAADRMGEVVEA